MKKLTKKSRIPSLVARGVLIIIILATVRYAVIFLFYWINPIGGREHNRRPNDQLSRLVKEAVGDDFYYHGKEESDSGVTEYGYQVKKQEKEAITNLVNTLDDAVKNEQRKIRVTVFLKFPGGIEPVFSVENFSDEGLETADYDGMYAACIIKPDIVDGTIFDSPSVYTEIEGIRKLYIIPQMRTQAEKEEIDWYELWPDLEEVKIIREKDYFCGARDI